MQQFRVADVREHFKQELAAERFTTDKTGQKTIEWIGASFLADEPAIFGTVNQEYVDREIEWYRSGSLNINDIYGSEREPPAAWKYAANEAGEINSNYGHLIFTPELGNQFINAVTELTLRPDSRRAIMIYNRPSMWWEYKEDGKNDFVCTNAVAYYIRDSRVHAVVQMRSNDVVFGYKNDRAWAKYILNCMARGLGVEPGDIFWQVQNLHVYEKHFHLVE